MIPANLDFKIYQGSSFQKVLFLKDKNKEPYALSGFTADMQIRVLIDDATPIVDLTTENGGLTIDATLGTITIYIADTATASLDFEEAVYDLKIDSGSRIHRVLEGKVYLDKQVTR